MVDSLHKLVSGNRRRYTEDNVSLDLTYIIPNRLIAMSYPSSGFESLYRNSIDKVSKHIARANLWYMIGRSILGQQTWKQVLHTQHLWESHLWWLAILWWPRDQLPLAGPPRTTLRLPLPDSQRGLRLAQSWSRERADRALQLGKGSHWDGHLRRASLHGLLQQCGRLPQVLRPPAIRLRQRRQSAMSASLPLLLWGLLSSQNKVTSSKAPQRYPICAGAKYILRRLWTFLRSLQLSRTWYPKAIHIQSYEMV